MFTSLLLTQLLYAHYIFASIPVGTEKMSTNLNDRDSRTKTWFSLWLGKSFANRCCFIKFVVLHSTTYLDTVHGSKDAHLQSSLGSYLSKYIIDSETPTLAKWQLLWHNLTNNKRHNICFNLPINIQYSETQLSRCEQILYNRLSIRHTYLTHSYLLFQTW